jgi:hypothetical protein
LRKPVVGLELEVGGVGVADEGRVVIEEYADVDAEDAEVEAVGLTIIPTAVRDEKVRNMILATGTGNELPLLQHARASLEIPQQYHGWGVSPQVL